ncbi:MAG: selenide, water dikinase SelD [Candidatus Hermodarchaeota archaeon]
MVETVSVTLATATYCKLFSEKLEKLLANTGLNGDIEDSAIIPVPNTNLVMAKNIDIFTPIIDEPDIMGEIAAANVTNDISALNVPEISGMLVFLGLKKKMPMYIAEGILKGIKNFMENKLNSKILGGHTIFSQWPLIGGEASGFVEKDKIIKKDYVEEGDKIILTKPIGNQAIMAAYRLQKNNPDLLESYSTTEIDTSIDIAVKLMISPLQDVVKTIHTYKDMSFIHSMTDVSGFGLAGHLREMLQNSGLSAIIEKIPSIRLTSDLAYEFGYKYDECEMPETAGGMLLSVDHEYAEEFSQRLNSKYGVKNWTVGTIDNINKPKYVRVSENVEHIEITKI